VSEDLPPEWRIVRRWPAFVTTFLWGLAVLGVLIVVLLFMGALAQWRYGDWECAFKRCVVVVKP
jgi:hypothetical protein